MPQRIELHGDDLKSFMRAKNAREDQRRRLLDWFESSYDVNASPPIYEHNNPGARDMLKLWAATRNLHVVEEHIEVVNGAANMITRVDTHDNYNITVYWTKPVEAEAA